MKQFLRLGDCYVPYRKLQKQFIAPLICAFTLISCVQAVCAQVSAASGPAATAISDTAKPIKGKDLDRFPMVKHDPDLSQVKGLVIGDSIPDYLWDMPLWVVNHPDGRDTITLREYQDSKLLVLDFWAKFCKPCIESMDKWEGCSVALEGSVQLIGVQLDKAEKALPFIANRKWKSPNVVGRDAYVLNRQFFFEDVISRVVWIKDGKLMAITNKNGYDLQSVSKLIDGEDVAIPLKTEWTYQSIN